MGQPVDVRGPLSGQHHVVVGRAPVVPAERREVAPVLGHEVERGDPVSADRGPPFEIDSQLIDAAGSRLPAGLEDDLGGEQVHRAALVILTPSAPVVLTWAHQGRLLLK